MPLSVNVEKTADGVFTIRPVGSIDTNTNTLLQSEVNATLEKSPRLIIFDMKDLTFISSAGISLILTTEQFLKNQGGNALIVNLQPQVRKVFEIVQALPSQQIFSSIEEMDAYLKEIQRKVKSGEID